MRSLLSVLVAVVLGLIIVLVPLLVVHRSECRAGDRPEDEWSAEVPFSAERQRGCRPPESGVQLLRELVENGRI